MNFNRLNEIATRVEGFSDSEYRIVKAELLANTKENPDGEYWNIVVEQKTPTVDFLSVIVNKLTGYKEETKFVVIDANIDVATELLFVTFKVIEVENAQ